MSSTTTVPTPTRRRGTARGGSVVAGVLTALLGLLLLGGLLGVLWWWLAPLARADVQQGQVFLTGHQELQVSQDGWFSVVTGAAAVVTAAVLAARRRGHDPAVLLLGPPAALLVSLVAWVTGSLLGPSSLADQVGAGATHPITPLQLHAHGALLVGPLLLSVTRALAALFSRTDAAGDAHRAIGEPGGDLPDRHRGLPDGERVGEAHGEVRREAHGDAADDDDDAGARGEAVVRPRVEHPRVEHGRTPVDPAG